MGTELKRRRVLVVDDLVDAADVLGALLSAMGYEVQTAYDGQGALEKAEAFRPEIVLLDIGLPVLDGYEVARRVRSAPWGSAVTLVALTGWGCEEDKVRAAEAGFNRHLTKPLDPASLERLLG